MTIVRLYRIICLKRSNYPETKVYWRDNMAGYTDNEMEAGYYEAHMLNDCAGSLGDWIVEPIWIHEALL